MCGSKWFWWNLKYYSFKTIAKSLNMSSSKPMKKYYNFWNLKFWVLNKMKPSSWELSLKISSISLNLTKLLTPTNNAVPHLRFNKLQISAKSSTKAEIFTLFFLSFFFSLKSILMSYWIKSIKIKKFFVCWTLKRHLVKFFQFVLGLICSW